MKKTHFIFPLLIFFFLITIIVLNNNEEDFLLEPKSQYSDEFEKYFRSITYNEKGPNYSPGYKQVELNKMLDRLNDTRLSASNNQGDGDMPLGSSAAAVATFTERGPGNVAGRTRAILVDAADTSGKTFYAASPGGGIWKGINSGSGSEEQVTWTNLTTQLANINFNSLAQSQSNPLVIYAGTGETMIGGSGGWGDGMFKSTDGGATWTNVSPTSGGLVIDNFGTVTRIIVDPTNPDIVVATTGNNYYCNTFIYRSTDGGTSWSKIRNSVGCKAHTQIVAAQSNFNIQYAVAHGDALLKSEDAGLNWVSTSAFGISETYGRYEIAVSPTDPNKVYAGIHTSRSGTSYLYRTLDGGSTWHHIPENSVSGDARYEPDFWLSSQGDYDNCITINPYNDDIVYVGGIDIFKFTILGDSTKNSVHLTDVYEDVGSDGIHKKNGYVHPDQHTLTTVSDGAGKFRIILGNDGGFAYTNSAADPGINEGDWRATKYKWATILVPYEPTDIGYNTTQFYGADKIKGRQQYIGGTQDNGSYLSPKDSTAKATTPHARVWSGDGFEVVAHWKNKDSMMTGSQYNGLTRSLNGGINFSSISSGMKGSSIAPFFTKLSTSYQDPDVVYAVHKTNGIWRSTDFGANFNLISIPDASPNEYYVNDIEVSQANPRFVWTGYGFTADRNIFLSKDWGQTFSPVTKPSGVDGKTSGIYSHPTEDSTVYILFSKPKKTKVLESKDLGATWTDISGFPASFATGTSSSGFPNVETHSLAVMPFDKDVIWVGTNIGIVETTDRGASWNIIPYTTTNFPYVTVFDMKVKDQGEIVLATHGRGIWSATIPDLVNWEPKHNHVTLSVDTVSIAEAAAVATITATLQRDVSPVNPVTVSLVVSGTTAASDYTLSATTITISSGKTGTVTLTAVQDTIAESNETVVIDVGSVVNGKESGTQQVTVTIDDDDGAAAPPLVTIAADPVDIAEAAGVSTITATLNKAPNSGDVVISFTTSGDAASSDYTLSSNTITIASGTTGTATITAVQDTEDESDENIIIDVSSVTNGTESGVQQATVVIKDDDDTVAGIEDLVSGKAISIYPNPTSGIFKVRFNDTWKGNVDLKVLDIFGRAQYLRRIDNSSGQVEHEVDISNKTDGIFVLEIVQDDKRVIRKIVKQ